mgnify:CR=1 FL=1
MSESLDETFHTLQPIERSQVSYNYLSPTAFRVIIPKMPRFTYFIQSVSIPSVVMGMMEIPAFKGLPKQEAPSILDLSDDLIINFTIDENMQNWQEMYDWMTDIVPTDENFASANMNIDKYSPIIVLIYNNAKKLKKKITFNNCFPITLSGFEFNSASTDIDPITIAANFEFSEFTVETF